MRPPEAAFGRERPAKYATESSPILLLAEAEIRKLAIELHGTLDSVDILLNIVGGIYARGEPTTDGVEKTLALNHLAPCLLTTLLLDPVRAARRGQRRTLPEIEVHLALEMLSAEPQQSEMSMSGKTVLITGATSGLGLATALLLAERGAEVVMVGRDRTRSNFMRTEVANVLPAARRSCSSQTCRRRQRSIVWLKSFTEVSRGSMS